MNRSLFLRSAAVSLMYLLISPAAMGQLQPTFVLPLLPPLDDGGFGRAIAIGDFDGDGHDDAAISMPFAQPGGAVEVIKLNDLTTKQLWTQDSPGIVGVAESGPEQTELFGRAIAVGDFDADGYDDLAIGVPWESLANNTIVEAGAVNVIYGSADLLSAEGNQFWTQATAGVLGTPEAGDSFGSSLTAGDFNGDGFDDLAIGVPEEDHALDGSGEAAFDAGVVHIIFGSDGGLTSEANQLWAQNDLACGEHCDDIVEDQFGFRLASGNFNGDEFDDLAIVAFLEQFEFPIDGSPDPVLKPVGVVHVMFGTESGISESGNLLLHQNLDQVEDEVSPNENFGQSLAVGDFDGDGMDDLFVGVSRNRVDGNSRIGSVNVFTRLVDHNFRSELIVPINSEEFTDFGSALAVGDFNNDGKDDLAVGAPNADEIVRRDPDGLTLIDTLEHTGSVSVYYHGNSEPRQIWHQKKHPDLQQGLAGEAEPFDRVGAALAAGDWNSDGVDDLLVGAPTEDLSEFHRPAGDSGMVGVLLGKSSLIFRDNFE